jgi:biofilm PGA synthesis N-glycosyltransferase PgaC
MPTPISTATPCTASSSAFWKTQHYARRGTVLVRNSRANWITQAQEWDYFHGIAAIKRTQSLFQGTLVAQGSFSLYDRTTVAALGGWPECVGEDIVLTWAILKAGYRVGHCEDACVFTNAPATLKQFFRQRRRWARGMVEAFKRHPGILLKPQLPTFFIYWNLLFPLMDLAFTIGFIPGLVLALFGHYWIVGPMTLALIPLGLSMNLFMFWVEVKMFNHHHLKVRKNPLGFMIYVFVYSLLLQPICLMGYLSEIFNFRKMGHQVTAGNKTAYCIGDRAAACLVPGFACGDRAGELPVEQTLPHDTEAFNTTPRRGIPA